MTLWQLLVGAYGAYAVIIVVRLYAGRDTRPRWNEWLSHLLLLGLAVVWPLGIAWYVVRRRRERRARERAVQAFLESLVALQRRLDNVAPRGYHYDPVLRERLMLCFNPDCPCRGHERDGQLDPNDPTVRSPEDYWQ